MPASASKSRQAPDLAVSRSNKRGEIQAANAPFQQLSGHRWDELIGAPHKILRHPDMPAGLFWTWWDRLGRGAPTGGYVLNRAEGWRFLLLLPDAEGYVGLSLAANGPLREVAQTAYVTLRKTESQGALTPEKSAARLAELLAEAGHADYDAFARAALLEEWAARPPAKAATDLGLNGTKDMASASSQTQLGELAELIGNMRKDASALIRQFETIRSVPTNLRIAAVALGDAGLPLSAISENYALMVREIWTQLGSVTEGSEGGFGAMVRRIETARAHGLAAALLDEAAAHYADGADIDDRIDLAAESANLKDMGQRAREAGLSELGRVVAHVGTLSRAIAELKRLVSGLDMTRVLCRVESGRLSSVKGSALVGIIDQLDKFHSTVTGRLDGLSQLAHAVGRKGGALLPATKGSGRPTIRPAA